MTIIVESYHFRQKYIRNCVGELSESGWSGNRLEEAPVTLRHTHTQREKDVFGFFDNDYCAHSPNLSSNHAERHYCIETSTTLGVFDFSSECMHDERIIFCVFCSILAPIRLRVCVCVCLLISSSSYSCELFSTLVWKNNGE